MLKLQILNIVQLLGDFQTPYLGFAPGPHWGTSIAQTPLHVRQFSEWHLATLPVSYLQQLYCACADNYTLRICSQS